MYQPNPIDTSKIELPEDILQLVEQLAQNVHDQWALLRIKEGWVYGEKRDDILKHHPCLVPYDQLPENEKEYDKKMAIENLKTILSLGYQITK